MTKTLQVWLKGAAAAAAMAVASFVLTLPATAGQCGSHEVLTNLLTEQYLERQRGVGLTSDGALLEFFVSEKGTWTAAFSLPATAQGPRNCGPHDKIVGVLNGDLLKEERVAVGISSDDGVLMELFVNLQTSTYTILTTISANGMSCIVAAGKDFAFDTPDVPGVGM